ncbi:MAG: hypothetical protein K9I68_08220 [Bacteroidales bacterium]|nr:hypothetical protein [Bacteroidales bacterium]MCF8338831.1 hypothetical protein [Bacteroidales bacterium]
MPENYKLVAEKYGNEVHVNVNGVPEMLQVKAFRNDLIEKIEEAGKVVIDLRTEEELNIAFLQILIAAAKSAKKEVSLRVEGNDEQKTVLKNAGLNKIIKLI